MPRGSHVWTRSPLEMAADGNACANTTDEELRRCAPPHDLVPYVKSSETYAWKIRFAC